MMVFITALLLFVPTLEAFSFSRSARRFHAGLVVRQANIVETAVAAGNFRTLGKHLHRTIFLHFAKWNNSMGRCFVKICCANMDQLLCFGDKPARIQLIMITRPFFALL